MMRMNIIKSEMTSQPHKHNFLMFFFLVLLSFSKLDSNETVIELEELERIDEPLKGESIDTKKYNFTFLENESIVSYGDKSLLRGFLESYLKHKSITLSPDIIWLMIVQGFSYHVAKNHEKLQKGAGRAFPRQVQHGED